MRSILCIALILMSFVLPASADGPAATQPARSRAFDGESRLPDLRFNNNALLDVFDFLQDITNWNIVVDWHALNAAGITKETPISLQLRDVKASIVLMTILEQAGQDDLRYAVIDGSVIITTEKTMPLFKDRLTRWKKATEGLKNIDRTLPQVNFNANSFSDVIDFLREVTGLNIYVNWPALEKAGLKKDMPITFRVRETTAIQTISFIAWLVGQDKMDVSATDDYLEISAKSSK